MPFRALFREICGFVCTRFTGSEFVGVVAQTMNDTVCIPTASAIILHASSTIPALDTTPSFGLSSLITMFWCVVLSLVYLMSFPNRLSTTLAAALERSRAEALGKELSAVKIVNENLNLKYQLAVDELDTKLKQTVEAHELNMHDLRRDAAKKYAKSTKILVDKHRTQIDAKEEACKKEIEKMIALYEKNRRTYELKNTDILDDLRSQLSTDDRRNKKAAATFERTIKDQEIRLNQAGEDIRLLEKDQTQIEKDAGRLRQAIEVQKKRSSTVLAEKDHTINDLTQQLQRTQKKLSDTIAETLSQDSVDEKDWDCLERKISKLEKEAALAWREVKGSEAHIQFLNNQLRDTCDMYNAMKLEAERQTEAACKYATRATLKRARMRKAVAKRSKDTRSTSKVEGQVTAPKAAKIEDHSKKVWIHAQATARTITDPEVAQSPEAIQLKRITNSLKTVEAELLICRESAKIAHETATQDLEAANASLVLSKSEWEILRTRWSQEQIEYLRTQTELRELQQKLDRCGQHSGQLQAKLDARSQSLDQERIRYSRTQAELAEVKQKLDHCGQHSGHLQAKLEAVSQNLDQERSSSLQAQEQVSGLEHELQERRQQCELLKRQLEEGHDTTRTASTKVSELTLALSRANDQLKDKEDEKLVLQQQITEYAVESSDSNSAPGEAMEVERQIEEIPMEWQEVVAPVTPAAGAILDQVGDSTALVDMVGTYDEPSETQSEDAFMEDESPEEATRPMEEAMSADPSDMAMTAAPTASEPAFPTASAIALPVSPLAPAVPHETGLSSQLPPQPPQDTSGQLSELFSDFDQSLLDPALFEETRTILPPPGTDAPTFSQALGFLALVNFEMQQQQNEPASYPEPPETQAHFLFDPHRMSLNEFTAFPRPQEVASLPYFSPPPRISAAILEGSSQTEESCVQSTAPPRNALSPFPVVESSVDTIPNALLASSSIPSTYSTADPPLSIIQQGKRREDRPVEVEGEVIRAVSAKPDMLEEQAHLEKRPGKQSWSDEIDPSHEIFNGGYASSDFDDDDGSTISSVDPEEIAEWEARQDALEAAELKRIDDELKARARKAGPGPSSSNTAPAERRVIAPKSKKSKRR